METSRSEHIKTAPQSGNDNNPARDSSIKVPHSDLPAERASSPDRPQDLSTVPLYAATFLRGLGWVIFIIIGVAVAYFVIGALPQLPEIVFYPVLFVVLYVELLVKVTLFQTRVRLDSQRVVYGPPWARKNCSFAEITAVQLLDVARIARTRRKEPRRLFEINLVTSSSQRLAFALHKDKAKARNIAYSFADIFKVPVVEQFYVGA
jgi:hypothetical protein